MIRNVLRYGIDQNLLGYTTQHQISLRMNPPLAAFLHDQLGQMEEAIVLQGLRMKAVGEFCRGVFSEGAEAKPVLQFGSMPTTILLRGEVVTDGFRPHIDLFGDKRDQGRRRPLIGPQRPPWSPGWRR
jgi:hypothetical protein